MILTLGQESLIGGTFIIYSVKKILYIPLCNHHTSLGLHPHDSEDAGNKKKKESKSVSAKHFISSVCMSTAAKVTISLHKVALLY